MSHPTALITGANRGIGLELTRLLAERGMQVIAACRNSSPGLDALAAGPGAVQVVAGVDVTEAEGLERLVTAVAGRSLSLLINNAGLLSRQSLESLDEPGIRQQFEVNALGPLRVVHALLGSLGKGAKVAMLTSRMGSIADNTSGSHYGYRMSKAALNIASVSLAQDLGPLGVAVALLHPGYVKTDMTGNSGNVLPADAARDLLARIDGLTLETSGTFWHANGEVLPW